jgi:dTMP kinase
VFITFDGVDGSGKTTQLERTLAFFSERGFDVVRTREPGGTRIANQIRALLVQPSREHLFADAELFLFLAARIQHVQLKIKPALAEGKVVLCDRFFHSTLVYQGMVRGLGLEWVRGLNDVAMGGAVPDYTFILDLPAARGLERADRRTSDKQLGFPFATEDRFEREGEAFHKKVRDGFLLLAESDPQRNIVIDASASIDKVWQSVRFHLERFVKGMK